MSVEELTPARMETTATAAALARAQLEAAEWQPDGPLALTFEHAGIGIAEVDAEGRLLRANARLCQMMGYPAAEVPGRSIFADAHPEDVAGDYNQFRRQVLGEIDRYNVEKRIRRRGGDYFWAAVTSTSVRDSSGRFLRAVRVQHDISERKYAEEALARRQEEQGALFEFTERLQQARSIESVCQAAVDAIRRALGCDRASVQLFDRAGVTRFVASRGLSEAYRRAVESYCPWTPESPDPQPIRVPDVREAAMPADILQAVAAEGIAALAFIPLQEGGRLLGKFMAYWEAPHAFAPGEIDLALTLARQLAFAVARAQSERAILQLASIVESSDDAIISKDLDGIITTWNRGAERLFGYTAAEAVGKPITLIIPPDRLAEEPGILARIRRGEPIDHFETVRRRKDGSLIDISLTVSPMRDGRGRIVGASKIARDITERKEAEARLRDSERHLQELLSAMPAAIYTTDAQGRITYFNQAAVDLVGRTPTLGSDEWCVSWKLYWPDGKPMPHDQSPMAVALREGRIIRNAEAVAERPDGSRVPFIPYPTPLRDAGGRIVGAINMLVDISERRHAETQQRVLLNELNHRVKNNMQMLQSLLDSAARQTQNAEARKILAEAGGRIAAMAAAQRVLYGTIDAARFSAQEFLSAVCETVQQTTPETVRIVFETDAEELSNDIAMPLALILNELLINAVKHGLDPRGGGTIRVTLKRGAEGLTLAVEDCGPGFDLEAVRGRSSGLKLVQGLARQLRGRFEVRRTPVSRCSLHFP